MYIWFLYFFVGAMVGSMLSLAYMLKPSWQPVSNPPRHADYYSVYDGKRVYDCYYVPGTGFIAPTTVTHWTYLPPLPKK